MFIVWLPYGVINYNNKSVLLTAGVVQIVVVSWQLMTVIDSVVYMPKFHVCWHGVLNC